MTSILVLDGDQRAALAVVRSLGSAGHQVVVGTASARSLAGGSRFCRDELLLPDSLWMPDAFAGAVEREVRQRRIDVVMPITEASLLALLPIRSRLAPAVLPFPDEATFRAICDKERVLAAAAELGIAVPRQEVAHTRAELQQLAASLQLPVVLKPSRSVAETSVNGGGRRKLTVTHARDARSLMRAADELPDAAYPLLVQERIAGDGIGIFLLLWRGQLVAQFAHRRLREKPPSGGVSVYRESIPAEPALVGRSERLLQHFNWSGVAMVEYKVDRATGRPYLMEINGRFWGSLQLAIDAGVDFPGLLLECALHEDRAPAPVLEYRTGVRSRWWWGDVDHLIARLRTSREELGLTDNEPSRLGALARFLTLWRPGDRSEVLRAGDARPFIRETAAWFANVRGGMRGKRARGGSRR